jgi:hypothetical protein
MSVDKMSVDKMSVNKMSVNKMSVDKMSVDKMSVDKMSVDKLTWRRLYCIVDIFVHFLAYRPPSWQSQELLLSSCIFIYIFFHSFLDFVGLITHLKTAFYVSKEV